MTLGSRAARFATGAILIAAITLTPLTPLAPGASVTPARAAEACTPGAVARIPGPPPVLTALDAEPGTLGYTGKGVLVAVVDSGVDGTRPQLADAIAAGSTSLVTDEAQPDGLGDPFGHGTAVAGIIAAQPESGSGVTGVAPDAQLVSIRVFSGTDDRAEENGTGPDANRLAAGIKQASDLGAQIIAVAMSDAVDTPALREASAHAAANGSLIVASAGNRATTENFDDSPRYPAAYPGALSVTAVTLSGRATDDSIHGDHVDVAAPGQKVLTIASGAGDCMYAPDAPSSSFSTAYVAGVAALLAEAFPEEGPEGWAYRLMATADRPNPDARDDMIGWGRIQPAAALALRPDRTTRGPVSPFANTSGSEVTRPHTQIQRSETPRREAATPLIVVAVVGSLVLILAISTQTRMRRAALAEEEAAAAAREATLADPTDEATRSAADQQGDNHP